jgi:hypothetical protein
MLSRQNVSTILPAPFSGFKTQGAQLSLSIPAKPVVVLELATN